LTERTYSENGLLDHLLVRRVLRRGGLLGGRGLAGGSFGSHVDRFEKEKCCAVCFCLRSEAKFSEILECVGSEDEGASGQQEKTLWVKWWCGVGEVEGKKVVASEGRMLSVLMRDSNTGSILPSISIASRFNRDSHQQHQLPN
jgi:hypothetical protein